MSVQTKLPKIEIINFTTIDLFITTSFFCYIWEKNNRIDYFRPHWNNATWNLAEVFFMWEIRSIKWRFVRVLKPCIISHEVWGVILYVLIVKDSTFIDGFPNICCFFVFYMRNSLEKLKRWSFTNLKGNFPVLYDNNKKDFLCTPYFIQ